MTYRYFVTIENPMLDEPCRDTIRQSIRDEITSNLESVYPRANVAVVSLLDGFTLQPLPTFESTDSDF